LLTYNVVIIKILWRPCILTADLGSWTKKWHTGDCIQTF